MYDFLHQSTELYESLIKLLWFKIDVSQFERWMDVVWNIIIISMNFAQIWFITYVPQKLLVETEKLKVELLDLHHAKPVNVQNNVSCVRLFRINHFFSVLIFSWNSSSYRQYISIQIFIYYKCLNVIFHWFKWQALCLI